MSCCRLYFCWAMVVLVWALDDSIELVAQTKSVKERVPANGIATPRDYKSRNFLLHTDLSKEEAEDLLQRLEKMLQLISRYWGQPNSQTIEMYVVRDLKVWPGNLFPPRALESLTTGGGVTLGRMLRETITKTPIASQAIVYAVADHGTPQHEAVHAYCMLNFAETGPVWYSEGMAEMGQYWRDQDLGAVNCREEVLAYLKKQPVKPLSELVDPNQTTGDSWQNYAWRWLLCHMLANNTNYAPRFRPLGLSILQRKGGSFEETYGSMAREIEFEYRLFHQIVEPGFRCDLCSWDWKSKFQPFHAKLNLVVKVEAQRGWQATRLQVKPDDVIQLSAEGAWKLTKKGESISAEGDEQGVGRLQGVLFQDYQLSEPFELPARGTWQAPAAGKLYVRCAEPWGQLGDNSGTIALRIKAP